ncbi:MAG: cell division protein FtsA [Ktedonobacterales bacterium]
MKSLWVGKQSHNTITMPETLLAGVDIGSGKIAILVAELAENGDLTLLSATETPAHGVRQGVIANIETATAALGEALERAESASGQRISSAFFSLGGRRLRSQNLAGATAITPSGREIARDDIGRAIGAARAALPQDEKHETLHVIPRRYTVDDLEGVHNPIGMSGFELGVEAHMVTTSRASVQNLMRCAQGTRLEVEDIVAAPLAAGEGIVGRRNDGLSVAVADLGAETLNLAVYADGAIWRSECLPVGGEDVTRELALELRLSVEVAEQLKRRFGSCDPLQIAEDDLIELDPIGFSNELLPRRLLAELIQRRVGDFAEALRGPLAEARRAGVRPATLLLTGGGAELVGIDDFLAERLQMPSQIARPRGLHGMSAALDRPAFAVATGLLLWGARQWRRTGASAEMPAKLPRLLQRVRTKVFTGLF